MKSDVLRNCPVNLPTCHGLSIEPELEVESRTFSGPYDDARPARSIVRPSRARSRPSSPPSSTLAYEAKQLGIPGLKVLTKWNRAQVERTLALRHSNLLVRPEFRGHRLSALLVARWLSQDEALCS